MLERFKKIFWKLPISIDVKNRIRDLFPRNNDIRESYENIELEGSMNSDIYVQYTQQILNFPTQKNSLYKSYCDHKYTDRKAKIIAYYLTQYHPTEKNNLWWGKGTTEWTNVTKSVPQFISHSQPKLPSDLGFYDLRIPENMAEQVRVAKNYGVDAFCFYYYWFNGERALEGPLNMFLEHKEFDIQYSLCWCNEDWTERYSGVNSEVLLSVGKSEESYKRFIDEIIPYFNDERYLTVDNKIVLTIYRPSQIPQTEKIISFWRAKIKEVLGRDLYLIASQEANIDINWLKYGFDAVSQFQPASIIGKIKPQNDRFTFLRTDFDGKVYDYPSIVKDKPYKIVDNKLKIYPAVMPSWDNTPRRNYRGNIFYGSTPDLYKEWLQDAIEYVSSNKNLEGNLVFVNAWNEWGEGACLEPDREYGYAYLEATYQANCGCCREDE